MYAFAFNDAATVVIRSESNEKVAEVLKGNKCNCWMLAIFMRFSNS